MFACSDSDNEDENAIPRAKAAAVSRRDRQDARRRSSEGATVTAITRPNKSQRLSRRGDGEGHNRRASRSWGTTNQNSHASRGWGSRPVRQSRKSTANSQKSGAVRVLATHTNGDAPNKKPSRGWR